MTALNRFVALVFAMNFAICSYSFANDTDNYKKAIAYINDYEVELGVQELQKIIYSDTATKELKTTSYLWISFTGLLDGKHKNAIAAIEEMLSSQLGDDIDFSKLPEELAKSTELKNIYNKAKTKFNKNKEKNKKNAKKYLKKSTKYFQMNKLNKAAENVNSSIKLDATNKDAMILKIQIEEKQKVLNKISEDFETYFKETEGLLKSGKTDIVLQRVELMSIEHSDNYKLQDLKRDLASKHSLSANRDETIVSSLKKADKFFKKQQNVKAKEELKAVLEIDPGNKKAIALVNKIQLAELESTPDQPKAVAHSSESEKEELSAALQMIEDYDMSSALDKFIDLKERTQGVINYKSRFGIAFIHLFNGDSPAARKEITQMFKSNIGHAFTTEVLPSALAQNVQLLQMYEEEKAKNVKKKTVKKISSKSDKKMKKAWKQMRRFKLEKAEAIADIVLLEEPGHSSAVELKNKLKHIREIRIEVGKKLEKTLYKNAVNYYATKRYIKSMYDAGRALEYNPKNQDASMIFTKSNAALLLLVEKLSKKDRRLYKKAISKYLSGNYKTSVNIFRKLHKFLPEVDLLLSEAVLHGHEQSNVISSRQYYKQALKDYVKRHYNLAEKHILTAIMMDYYYLDAHILLNIVREELKSK